MSHLKPGDRVIIRCPGSAFQGELGIVESVDASQDPLASYGVALGGDHPLDARAATVRFWPNELELLPHAPAPKPANALIITVLRPDGVMVLGVTPAAVPGYGPWQWTWEIVEPGPNAPVGQHPWVMYTATAKPL